MDQTAFLSWSTKTGFSPPAMHFLAQAAPVPACLAPHMESEIQPLMDDESAAWAATAADETRRANKAMRCFMRTSGKVEIVRRRSSCASRAGLHKQCGQKWADAMEKKGRSQCGCMLLRRTSTFCRTISKRAAAD